MTGRACSDARAACLRVHRYSFQSLAFGKAQYRALNRLCEECAETCRSLASLCLSRDPTILHQANQCIRACEACIVESKRLGDDQLAGFSEICGETARLCRELAAAWWEERQRWITASSAYRELEESLPGSE